MGRLQFKIVGYFDKIIVTKKGILHEFLEKVLENDQSETSIQSTLCVKKKANKKTRILGIAFVIV
jgi:hypothetical protein